MQRVRYLNSANIYSEDEDTVKIILNENVKIITPSIVKKYKKNFKIVAKLNKNRAHILYIMYEKAKKWYETEKYLNVKLEKVHIKSKLGSYISGGCGIGASFFASIMASGLFLYIKKFEGSFYIIGFSAIITLTGIKILISEDKEVEMYNIFLEVLENIENDKFERRG